MTAPVRQVIVDGIDVRISAHAVTRYQERVRPGLGYMQAGVELVAACRFATFRPTLPEWVDHPDPNLTYDRDQPALELCDGVLLVLRDSGEGYMRAVSCLTRGGRAAGAHAYLAAAKRRARSAKRARRRAHDPRPDRRQEIRSRLEERDR